MGGGWIGMVLVVLVARYGLLHYGLVASSAEGLLITFSLIIVCL